MKTVNIKLAFLLLTLTNTGITSLAAGRHLANKTANTDSATAVVLSAVQTFDSLTYTSLADTGQASTPDTLTSDTLSVQPDSTQAMADSLTVVMVGDVMLGTNYPGPEFLPPHNDCWPLLSPFARQISSADVAFCNLEGGFAGNHGTAKNCRDPKTCYVFRVPDEYVTCIDSAGFDVVSVANNHVNDFGYAGMQHTAEVLTEAGIQFAGYSDYPYTIFESKGLTIGFCAFAPNRGVRSMLDIPGATAIVRYLNDSCDIVIVSVHGGAEGASFQHVTREWETFLGTDRGNVYSFAHTMIDAGADIIIGHGPHVTRAMELYNDRFIAYSLGNFSTYARFNLSGPNGIAPLVKIWVDRQGAFLKGEVVPVMQVGEGGAQPDPDKRVIFKLQELIQADFPDNPLQIDNEGRISR